MKRALLQYANKLVTRTCCDDDSYDTLSEQLQNTQHSCNDIFGKMHSHDNKDSKGNLQETACELLKDRKIQISRKADGYRRRSMDGKRGKHGRRSKYTRRINKKK